MIKQHRIYYFYQAVKYGGIRNAADILNVAPSSISRQITLLEGELKTILLEKNLRGAVPTEAGLMILKYFEQTQEQAQDLVASLSALQGLERGKVTIAAGEGYLIHLSKVISDFSTMHPNIKIDLSVCASNHVLRKVTDSEAHIGVAFNPEISPNIRTHLKKQHALKVFLHLTHPLAKDEQPFSLKKIHKYPIALSDISQGIRQMIKKVEEIENIYLQPSLKCAQLHMLKHYAIGGRMTILPEFMYYPEDKEHLLLKDLEHPFFNNIETRIITRLGRQLPPAAQKLLLMVMKEFQS